MDLLKQSVLAARRCNQALEHAARTQEHDEWKRIQREREERAEHIEDEIILYDHCPYETKQGKGAKCKHLDDLRADHLRSSI